MAIVKWHANAIINQAKSLQEQAINKACSVVTRSIKTHFPDSGSRKASQSKPGKIPFRQTGTLSRSIGWEIISEEEGHVGPQLGFKDENGEEAGNYGAWLELGTKNMAPRPYLRPGLDRERAKILKIFGDTFTGKVVSPEVTAT